MQVPAKVTQHPRMMAAAGLWGLAEATLFFIVPDVLLSALALRRLRAALLACVWATVGALMGGLLLHSWGMVAPTGGWAILDRVPGISPAMQADVRQSLAANGLGALLLGPISGIPYKLYALGAGEQGLPLAAFLGVSVPARGIRFVLICLLTHAIARPLPDKARLPVLVLGWLAFYGFYFTVMGW